MKRIRRFKEPRLRAEWFPLPTGIESDCRWQPLINAYGATGIGYGIRLLDVIATEADEITGTMNGGYPVNITWVQDRLQAPDEATARGVLNAMAAGGLIDPTPLLSGVVQSTWLLVALMAMLEHRWEERARREVTRILNARDRDLGVGIGRVPEGDSERRERDAERKRLLDEAKDERNKVIAEINARMDEIDRKRTIELADHAA